MNIKRIVAIAFSSVLIASTCVISVAAYGHTYVPGYEFTTYGKVNTSTVFNMDCKHASSRVHTKGTNKAGISTYMSVGATVYKKITGEYITDNANNGVCKNGSSKSVSCTDYRSTNTNVYYKHDCTIYGDTSGMNSSSKIATRVDTVG